MKDKSLYEVPAGRPVKLVDKLADLSKKYREMKKEYEGIVKELKETGKMAIPGQRYVLFFKETDKLVFNKSNLGGSDLEDYIKLHERGSKSLHVVSFDAIVDKKECA